MLRDRRGTAILASLLIATVTIGCAGVPPLKAGATRAEKQAYLDDLLTRIDADLVAATEADMRAYMNARLKHRVGPVPMMPLAYGHMAKRGDGYLVHCRNSRIARQGSYYLDAWDLLQAHRLTRDRINVLYADGSVRAEHSEDLDTVEEAES